jgi:uncharacterized protein (TIRG00374 family)
MTTKRIVRVVSLILGAAFLFFAFSKVQWTSFVAALMSMNLAWMSCSAAAILAAMYLRSVRWHFLTGLPRSDAANVWEAASIGYLGSVLLPARAGDFLRMLRLQQLTQVGGGVAIGSAIVDRIFDGLGLGALLVILLVVWSGNLEAQAVFLGLTAVFVVAAMGTVLFVLQGHRLHPLLQRMSVKGRIWEKLGRWYGQCLDALQALRSPKKLLLAFSLQLLVSLLDLSACWLLLKAFDLHLVFLVSVVFLVYLSAAVSLPAPPGYVGVYQIVALFALSPFGVDNSIAVAYGTALQVLTLVLFSGVGCAALLRQRRRERASVLTG